MPSLLDPVTMRGPSEVGTTARPVHETLVRLELGNFVDRSRFKNPHLAVYLEPVIMAERSGVTATAVTAA